MKHYRIDEPPREPPKNTVPQYGVREVWDRIKPQPRVNEIQALGDAFSSSIRAAIGERSVEKYVPVETEELIVYVPAPELITRWEWLLDGIDMFHVKPSQFGTWCDSEYLTFRCDVDGAHDQHSVPDGSVMWDDTDAMWWGRNNGKVMT